jgi:chemotaxis protein MotD
MPASQKTTPFDSILDETSRPAPEPRTQRTADDNSPRAERGQRTKSADRPDRPAKSDDKARPSDTDTPAKADSTADSAKTDDAGAKTTDTKAADTKSAGTTSDDKASDQTATTDDINVADANQQPSDTNSATPLTVVPVAVVIDPAVTSNPNSPPADASAEANVESTAVAATAATAATAAPAATTATAATDAAKAIAETTANPAIAAGATDETTPKSAGAPAETAAPAVTAVPAATAAPKVTATASQANVPAADVNAETALAQAQPNALAALGAKTEKTENTDKAELKSDKKSEADKKAAPAQTTLKPTATPDPDAAQAANGEPAKDTVAHARTEATANSHRGVTADTVNAAAKDGNAVAATPKTADLMPPPGLTVQAPAHTAQAQAAAAPIAVATQPDNSEPAVPIAGVAFEITSKALSGRNQFDIRLDPPDLGRIHVRLDVDRDGNVITHMVADRTDTLDLLRKDTTGLERALQDAGLKTSDNSLQFSLRDQQANQQQRNDGGESAHVVIEDEQLAAIEPAQRNYARYNASTGGLDIRV